MTAALRAGAAVVPFEAPLGAAMMGYGARRGVAEGQLDPLGARALWLEGPDGGLLIVACDVCLMAPQQAARVRAELARRTGLAEARILVGCVHTHSGPDTGLAALLGGADEPPHVAALLGAAVRAGEEAFRGRRPARLGVGHARAAIGRNRRRADGPLDEDVLLVRVDGAEGDPLAVLFVAGCHPTALGHDNLRYSADWPAAARTRVEARLPGAVALFALGAHADVDPRTRGLSDLAISGQSVGVSPEEAQALGAELGEAVAAAAEKLETHPAAPLAGERTFVALEARRPDEAGRRAAFAVLGLDPEADVATSELFRLEQERTAHLPEAERRAARARVRAYLRDRTARRFAFGARPQVEAQVLRLGDAWLLGLPLEATTAVGLDWKARMAGADAAVLSIANGWLRYLPHPEDYAAPGAESAYEVLQASFGPEAAPRLLEAGEALARRLARERAA